MTTQTWEPNLENIAHTFEDLTHGESKPESTKTLRWLLKKGEAARKMWRELNEMRPERVTLYEVAKLMAATESGGMAPECQPVVVWLLKQVPETEENGNICASSLRMHSSTPPTPGTPSKHCATPVPWSACWPWTTGPSRTTCSTRGATVALSSMKNSWRLPMRRSCARRKAPAASGWF